MHNIFLNALKPGYFKIMIKKLLKRIEKNSSIAALQWAKQHVHYTTEEFCISIDSNLFGISLGSNYHTVIFSKNVTFAISAQYQHLEKVQVTKTSGQEDLSAGTKIGGPGYLIGGNIISTIFSAKIIF